MTPTDPTGSVHPVIVVGGGLGGSAAAALLARGGVRSVVLERHDGPTPRPRAWVVSARSQEIFRELGLDEAVRTVGSPGAWDLQVAETLTALPDRQPAVDETAAVSATGSALCDQDLVEDLLRNYATEHGAEIRFGQTVTDLVDRGDLVEVHRDGAAPLLARYVVLADGARAGLLATLGITDTGPDVEMPGSAGFDQVLFRSTGLDELMAGRPGKAFLCTGTDAIVFRRDLGRWQLQRQGGRLESPVDDVAGAVGTPVDVEILDHSGWVPSCRLAGTFRAGRVFVLGDAAHAMPPSLGMAGNLAVADAHNLAWKLAWVLDGRAGPGLLDSYDAERRPVDAFVLEQSVAVTRGVRSIDAITVQLGLGYPGGASSALCGDGTELMITDPHRSTPTVGARLPHRRLSDGRSSTELTDIDTFVAVGGRGAATGRTDLPLPVVELAGLGDDPDRVWIVRPDGHVAARTEPARIAAVLDRILDRTATSSASGLTDPSADVDR